MASASEWTGSSRLTEIVWIILLALILGWFGGCVEKKRVYNDDVDLPPLVAETGNEIPVQTMNPGPASASTLEDSGIPEDPRRKCLVFEDGEMLFIEVPVEPGAEVSPTLKGRNLTLAFDRSVPSFAFPALPVGWVLDLQAKSESGRDMVDALIIRLGKDVQFLVDRSTPDTVRVTLKERKDRAEARVATSRSVRLENVDFAQDKDGHLVVSLAADGTVEYEPLPGPEDKIRLFLPGLEVPGDFLKLYRLEKFSTQVRTAMFQNTENGAELVFTVTSRVPMHVETGHGQSVFKFLTTFETQTLQTAKQEEGQDDGKVQPLSSGAETPEHAEELEELTALFPGMKREYTGQRISIDLQNADVEHVLRLIGEVSGYNLILDDNVSGKISLKLKDIPWDQALDLVLLQRNLGMVRRGNILRVTTAEKLQGEQKQLQQAREAAIQAKESLQNLVPLRTEYIQVNYTTSSDLSGKVREFLSPRGKVSQDARTNMLIVSDTPDAIRNVRSVVEKLDRPERQVMIEARIVYASDDFVRSLGLQWGGTSPQGELKENQTRTTMSVTGLQLPGDVSGFNVFGSLARWSGGDFLQLDARLQLGETKGESKTVSSPRVVTLNNEQASIEQGTKIAV
ncbi:MAG: hypothetical protein EOM25_10275, partial [Deltaproteobacteria bacterium]|nr:hypothetical protein [Deltaproteobacteria bacterium]